MPQKAGESRASRKSSERRLVTVLFADIVASSRLVSGRDPEEADEEIQAILAVLIEAVDRYGGSVSQVVGDGIMATFGMPLALEDQAQRACLAGQDIVSAALGSAENPGIPKFSVRVGIASGEVVAETVKAAARNDQRLTGECVHAAARLQQRAAPDTVMLTAETRALAPVGLTVVAEEPIRLAADARVIEVFRLVEATVGRRTALSLLSSSRAPFVGREAELATLVRGLCDAQTGSGRLMVLSGEAGIGKSRLAGELLARCAADGIGVVQWPQAAIRQLGAPDDLEAAAQSLLAMAGSVAGDGSIAALVGLAERRGGPLAGCAFGELLGVGGVGDPLWQALDPDQRLSYAIDGVVAALVELSGFAPIVLLVEDAHWMGGVTARVLDRLTALLRTARVLVVVTARQEGPRGWRLPAEAQHIHLDALSAAQIGEFLSYWLGDDESLATLKSWLAGQSQGMPLYLEESLRTLESAGHIEGRQGAFRAVATGMPVTLPASLRELIDARIATQDEECRETLRHAAVIGATFDARLLGLLAPVPEAAMAGVIDALKAAGFIDVARTLPNLEYRFRHALFQEVAYASLTRLRRRALHSRIVHLLRNWRTGSPPNRIELMAHHAFEAEEWSYACAFGHAAGRRAEARSKLDEAGRFYERALNAADCLPAGRRMDQRRIDLGIAHARTLLPRGIADAGEYLALAVKLAKEHGDKGRQVRAMSLKASFDWSRGELDNAVVLLRECLAALDGDSDAGARVLMVMRLAGVLTDKGLLEAADAAVSETLGRVSSDPCGFWGGLAMPAVCVYGYRARLMAELGFATAARAAGHRAIQLADNSGHPMTRIIGYAQWGWALTMLDDDLGEAVAPLETARQICGQVRAPLWMPMVLGCLGYVRGMTGDATTGMDLVERGLAGLAETRQFLHVHTAQLHIYRSALLLRTGRPDMALIDARTALTYAQRAGQLSCEARALLAVGEALAAQDGTKAEMTATLASCLRNSERLRLAPLISRARRALQHHRMPAAVLERIG